MTISGGITLFVTMVVTTTPFRSARLVRVVALKIHVVPPTGLFTLAVRTLV